MSEIKKHDDGWWIEDFLDVGDVGPYDTRLEALDSRRGMRKAIKHENDHSFFTCEPETTGEPREVEMSVFFGLESESAPTQSTEQASPLRVGKVLSGSVAPDVGLDILTATTGGVIMAKTGITDAEMAKYKSLDRMADLQPRTYKQGDRAGQRKKSGGKADEVTEKLASADTPSALAAMAAKVGITNAEIMARAKAAPNFGQFRMVLGNRIRGVYNRYQKAVAAGKKVTSADMAELAAGGRNKAGTGAGSSKAKKEKAAAAGKKEAAPAKKEAAPAKKKAPAAKKKAPAAKKKAPAAKKKAAAATPALL